MAGEDTPTRNAAQMVERDHFALKAVTASVNDLTKEVRGYRNDAHRVSAQLAEHIRSCDRRYGEMRDARRGESPGNGAVHPILKKVSEKLIDYVIFVVVALIVFAVKHGATIPLPSP